MSSILNRLRQSFLRYSVRQRDLQVNLLKTFAYPLCTGKTSATIARTSRYEVRNPLNSEILII